MSLVSDMAYCERLARKAYETVTQEWSPSVAAKRLLTLTDSLIDGRPTPYSDGPCSIAPVSRHPLIDTLI